MNNKKNEPLKLTLKEQEDILNILKENYHWLKTLFYNKNLYSDIEEDCIGIFYEEIAKFYKRYDSSKANFKYYLNKYFKYALRKVYFKYYNIIKIPEHAIKEHKEDIKSIVYAISGYRYCENEDIQELDFLYGYDKIDYSNFELKKLLKTIKHISLNVLMLPINYKIFYLHNVKSIAYKDIQRYYFPEISYPRIRQLNNILIKHLKPRLKKLGYNL